MTAQKYGPQLRAIANRILNDPGTADECENDTYLAAWKLIPPNEPRTYLFAFLGKITRHLAIDEYRKKRKDKYPALFCELTKEMEECIPARHDVEAAVMADALSQIISEYLDICPDDQRGIFVRRYWCFDTIDEISRRFGFSKSKVKTTLCRMRKGLRDHLEKEGYTI